MTLGLIPNDVDVFQTGAAIEPKIRQVLAEKSKALAKEENCDQGEDHNRNQRVAAEERFDRRFRR